MSWNHLHITFEINSVTASQNHFSSVFHNSIFPFSLPITRRGNSGWNATAHAADGIHSENLQRWISMVGSITRNWLRKRVRKYGGNVELQFWKRFADFFLFKIVFWNDILEWYFGMVIEMNEDQLIKLVVVEMFEIVENYTTKLQKQQINQN